MTGPQNVLLLSAGRRVELAQAIRADLAARLRHGKLIAADMRPQLSAACQVADVAVAVPRATDPTPSCWRGASYGGASYGDRWAPRPGPCWLGRRVPRRCRWWRTWRSVCSKAVAAVNGAAKIVGGHRDRLAVVYLRQSSMAQVREHTESTMRQYGLVEQAVRLGWARDAVVVIDTDLGVSGRWGVARAGFAELVARVCTGEVGAIFGLEISRLAQSVHISQTSNVRLFSCQSGSGVGRCPIARC
jgi:hypothetical protein